MFINDVGSRLSHLIMLYLHADNINEGRRNTKRYVAKWGVWRALRDAEMAMLEYRTKGGSK